MTSITAQGNGQLMLLASVPWWGWLLLIWSVLNLLTYVAFARDKKLAQQSGVSRIPEAQLLRLAAIGGVIGAKLAQNTFRHKTRKQPFASILNIVFGVHLATYVAILAYTAAVFLGLL